MVCIVTNFSHKRHLDKRFAQNTLQSIVQSRMIANDKHKLLSKQFLSVTKKSK